MKSHVFFWKKVPMPYPLFLLNDKAVKVGSYPTNEEFAQWFDVKLEDLNKKPKKSISFNLNQL